MSITTISKDRLDINSAIHLDKQGKTIVTDPKRILASDRLLTTNRGLSLIILPTEKCNFRCTYCYEDFEEGRMKKPIVQGVKALLAGRSPDMDFLSIEWFGGEPLLAKSVVLDISRFAMSMAFLHPHLHYHGSMTTNGALLDFSTLTELSNVGVRSFQISLDGPKDVHDQSRLRADGKGTFETIWTNLLSIRDSDLPVNVTLRLHVTAENYSLMDSLLADIKREFLPDARFSVLFKAIERLGGSNDTKITVLSHTEHDQIMNSLKTKLFGNDHNLPQNGDLPQDYICYASMPNSLIIRANGDVGKCTVALYDERNKVATLRPDGTLEVIPGRLDPWVKGLETLDPDTLACPLHSL
jgi:uncharacterized protein